MKKTREIKFRAWDKDSKRMLEVSYLSYGENQGRENREQARVMVFGTKEDDDKRIRSGGSVSITADGESFSYGTLQLELRNFVLMQFTGLKDKHGKEIFDGDIIKVPGAKEAMYITFIDGCFVAQTKDMAKRKSWSDLRIFETKTKITIWEIIGNIYENPELLK